MTGASGSRRRTARGITLIECLIIGSATCLLACLVYEAVMVGLTRQRKETQAAVVTSRMSQEIAGLREANQRLLAERDGLQAKFNDSHPPAEAPTISDFPTAEGYWWAEISSESNTDFVLLEAKKTYDKYNLLELCVRRQIKAGSSDYEAFEWVPAKVWFRQLQEGADDRYGKVLSVRCTPLRETNPLGHN
jgi:hypothetical protein